MKAITITQKLKDAKNFKKEVIGNIKKLNLPNTFFSLTHEFGKRTDGYHTLDNSIHEADGFFDVIEPVFNSDTEKLGDIFFDVNKFTFPIIKLTQKELDKNTERKEDNDNSSQEIQKYKNDGVIMFDRIMSLIQRKLDKGNITKNQAKNISEGVYDALEPLYKGMWRLTKFRLNNMSPPTNQKLLSIFNNIKNKIDNYITLNF